MKLCAIFNVWDDFEMLDHSTKAIESLVDGIIVVASTHSNYGEFSPIPDRWKERVVLREPRFNIPINIPMHSETDKRNYGLELARKAGYTHFLTIDSDEFYEPDAFLEQKARFETESDLKGLVCQCKTYFKSPTLTVGLDVTLVPFIHELTPTIRHEFNRKYPYAWIDGKIKIDPTRSLNITSGVKRTDLIMHHYSYIRADLEKKIRNSSARANIEKSTLREDYLNAAPGYYCRYYQSVLKECPNYFNIV